MHPFYLAVRAYKTATCGNRPLAVEQRLGSDGDLVPCGRALALPCTPSDPDLRDQIVATGVVQMILQLTAVGSPSEWQKPAYDALEVGYHRQT